MDYLHTYPCVKMYSVGTLNQHYRQRLRGGIRDHTRRVVTVVQLWQIILTTAEMGMTNRGIDHCFAVIPDPVVLKSSLELWLQLRGKS